ncbi:Hypothetical predicted protein [Paramuricea clavata]|uniref:Uncharacterized protein n=1 Tax=Paramuricea clavata TaxID=317549 RepID=A0A6S7GQ10_PARCT|nr:Hypothetical predicted protein [Paramuricea clavata]
MTVRGKSAGDSIQGKVDRDILFKVLLQKPTTKGRRDLVHSASSSFPSQISRKLLLEEHKLNVRLEKIEKERKLFLNRNSNEKHMLQLSMRTGKISENRRGSGQCLVLNDNAKCHSSSPDHGNLKEGNGMMRKSWTSTTNGVFYQSGAKSVRQLQVKKVCLLKKMAERHRRTNSLPWKRNFDTPQGPPPSRSPSKTNIIWVRVRNSSGEMEIDGFLRTNKDFEGLLPEGIKDNIVPTKLEVRLPGEQDMAHKDALVRKDKNTLKIDDLKLNTDTNTVLEKPYEENYSVLENVDTDFAQNLKQSMIEKESLRTNQEARQASSLHTEVLIDQLAPMVKGLKVSPNEIRRGSPVKQKSEELMQTEVYEISKYSRTGNDRAFTDEKSYVLKDKVKTAIPCPESESDAKSGRTDSRSDRKNIAGNSLNIESDRSNVKSGQQKIGSDRKKTKCSRQKIGRARSNTGSDRSNIGNDRKRIGSSRKSMEKIVRKNIGNDRENIGNDRENIGKDKKDINSERKTPSGGENANEGKTNRRHAKNSQGSGKSSSTKISKGKSVQKFVRTKPNVQGMCVVAKTFIITTKSKGKTGRKTQENEKGLSKPRSATRLNDKKSATKLPKKSCSACAVKTSLKDSSLRVATRDIRSKSDTAACSKVRAALQERGSGVSSPEKKSQSAVPIMIPSQTQLQNFDKVAKIKLRQTLAVKMRKHCYTGTWAFPSGQIRESEIEEKELNKRETIWGREISTS